MKSFSTLLLFIVILSSQSQNINYLENNPEWRQSTTAGYYYPCILDYNYVYYLDGDSAIENQTYAKVFRRGILEHTWFSSPPAYNCEGTIYYDQFWTLIRQDSLKLFIHDYDGEFLLYDFDLNVGDTLPQTYTLMVNGVIVSGTDSILVGDNYRKVFHLEHPGLYESVLIEGIGFEGGFLDMFPGFEENSLLICYTNNGITYWPGYGEACDLSVAVTELTSNIEYTYYPNPVEDVLNLKSENPIRIVQILGVNIMGLSTPLSFNMVDFQHAEIIMSHLNKGVYTLLISHKDNTISRIKILKK
jgi:hypothetical protein